MDGRETEMSVKYRRACLVGAGGVGFYTAVALARSLPHGVELHIWDADDFNGGLGYSRLPRVSNPSTKKVAMLRGFITVSMGDVAPTVYDSLFTGAEARPGDLVVDCSDMSLTIRRPIWALAQSQGARCIRVSYDGLNETVVVAEGLPFMSGNAGKGGYRSSPSTALSFTAGGIAAIVVGKVLSGELTSHVEFQVSINELLGLDNSLGAKIDATGSVDASHVESVAGDVITAQKLDNAQIDPIQEAASSSIVAV
jgi:hypothetical protein